MRKFFSNKYVYTTCQILVVIFGTFLMGVSFRSILLPNGVTPSGFSGLSAIFSDLLSNIGVNLSPSIIYILLNVLLFVLAIFMFGFKYILLTSIGILSYSLFMEIGSIPALNSADPLLMAIIGGAVSGIGVGIVFRAGGSTGGSDIVAMALNKKFPKIKTGQCAFMVNVIVITLSCICYGIHNALYALIAIFISSKMTDLVLDGVKSVKAVYIICDKDKEISEKLLKEFGRGVTKIDAEGMFSQKSKKMLLLLISNYQAPFVKQIVREIDKTAFVFSTPVNEAIGEKSFLADKNQPVKISELIKINKASLLSQTKNITLKRAKVYKNKKYKLVKKM